MYIINKLPFNKQYDFSSRFSPSAPREKIPELTENEQRYSRPSHNTFLYLTNKFTPEQLKLIVIEFISELYKKSTESEEQTRSFYNFVINAFLYPLKNPERNIKRLKSNQPYDSDDSYNDDD